MSLVRSVAFAAGVAAATAVAGPARAESITESLASAYANHPAIASALESVKVAAESIALSRAGQRPQISAGADLSASSSNSGGTVTNMGSASVDLSVTQRLFDNFQTDAQIDQARALTDAAEEGLRNVEQNVLLSAATAYLDVSRYTQLARLRSENMTFLEAQVQSAQDRLSIGEGTRIDVAQAQAGAEAAQTAYTAAVNLLQTARASFARWVGHAPSGITAGFPFSAMLPASLDAALAAADTHHPANLAARAQLAAAQHGTEAALRAFGPTLDLVGSISASVASSGPSPTTMGRIGLSLTVPIYSGGARGAGARQASLQETQTAYDAEATHFQIREAVISAWSGLQTAAATITSAESAVDANRIALDGVIEERNVGQRTTLDVLNARGQLVTSQESLVNATHDKYLAAFSLLAAVGRLSAADLNLPVGVRSGDAYRAAVEDVWGEIRDVDELVAN